MGKPTTQYERDKKYQESLRAKGLRPIKVWIKKDDLALAEYIKINYDERFKEQASDLD